MRELLQNAAMKIVDWVMAAAVQPQPSQSAFLNCKVISHRGEHDNISVIENTLTAFSNARSNGVWGIECDIRWTSDLVPVITHDSCGSRLFANSTQISELSFAELRAQMPLIPSVAELVSEFGGNTHLMLEIKDEHYPQPEKQLDILRDHLAPLSPGAHYHFLALDPQLFGRVSFVEPKYCFPVSETNVRNLSDAAIDQCFGGLTGHYLLLNNTLKERHAKQGQRIGTGFISSKNCLFRELNRGVEWIFSNDAVKIQRIRDRHVRANR